ncbi:hypothetical protein EYZ11_011502 [Aspergillus tanneri]|uniref:Carrier domain-containing protein n=1 Tax=Aspergillus tanneri TaxID=1220188 RepID=A0A4S3J2M0_9EURO|nr:hypothetical protein EYZ11_011502 [Aspergillus tanneri]
MSSITRVVKPFSLLGQEVNIPTLIDELATRYNIDPKSIEDIYPCTPMQEGFLALSARHKGSYVHNIMIELADNIRLDDFCSAWKQLVQATPILRTRFVHHKTLGLLQMPLREEIHWIRKEGRVEEMGAGELPVELGQPLTRYTIVSDTSRNRHWFIWTLHHSVNDGGSRWLISAMLSDLYHGRPVHQQLKFNTFVKHIREQDWVQGRKYWRDLLEGGEPMVFPSPLGAAQTLDQRATTEWEHSVVWNRKWKVGRSTLVSAAWALTLHRFNQFKDIVFGTVISGRRSHFREIQHITGPTIATVPIRFQIRNEESVAQYLAQAHEQAVQRVPYEQMGMQNIAQVSEDAHQACGFHNLLVVQAWGNSWYPDERIGICHTSPVDLAPVAYQFAVQCFLGPDRVRLHANFSTQYFDVPEVNRMLDHLGFTLNQIMESNPDDLIARINCLPSKDFDQLWKWNAAVPTPVDKCVDRLITTRALQQAEAIAVSAWDGILTYGDLDRWSTQLANYLTGLGVQNGTVVPLYFRKSLQMPVATLGVLKAGGTALQLSYTVPIGRIKTILSTVSSKFALASPIERTKLCDSITTHTIPPLDPNVSVSSKWQVPHQSSPELPAFILFTSGSTGTPKGIVWSHQALSSNVNVIASTFALGPQTRMFQFASYDFDVSILDTYSTLVRGGCLYIPDEEERVGNLPKAMATSQVNCVFLTPSVAEGLSPSSVPSLQTLALSGENLRAEVASRWLGKVRVLANWYGPAEAPAATISFIGEADWASGTIGSSWGGVCWVVDPNDPDVLLPIGAVGELLVEGPIITDGYIGVEASIAEKSMYRTGDLVRYNPNGTLMFLGRKDGQVKIRGQRVEIGEIEHQVQRLLGERGSGISVIVDVITPKNSSDSTLVVFLAMGEEANGQVEAVRIALERRTRGLNDSLYTQLPRYMVPSYYIPVSQIPMTATGKTNRRRLHDIGEQLTLEQLAELQPSRGIKRMATTTMEYKLQKLWASALKFEPSQISANDNFFSLGGNSIAAMQVAALARDEGVNLSAADMFEQQDLGHLATFLEGKIAVQQSKLPNQPFSLAASDILSSLDIDAVEDVLPVTGPQVVSLTQRSLLCCSFTINGEVDIGRLKAAWKWVVQRHSILRTVFIEHQGRFYQVIRKSVDVPFLHIQSAESLDTVCESISNVDIHEPPVSGKPLVKLTLVSQNTRKHVLIVRLSHTQYDGHCLPILFKDLSLAYNEDVSSVAPAPYFSDYVYYCNNVSGQSAFDFWRRYLQGSFVTAMPPSNLALTDKPAEVRASFAGKHPPSLPNITFPTLVNAALCFILAELVTKDDILFGMIINTRDIPLTGIWETMGQCTNIIPLRARLSPHMTVQGLCHSLQDQFVQVYRHALVNWPDIISSSTSWPKNTRIGCMINHLTSGNVIDSTLSLNGASVSSSSMSARKDLTDQVIFRSLMMGNRWEVQVLTSTTVMDTTGASLLAKRLYDVVSVFSQSPQGSIKIGRWAGTESNTQKLPITAKI